MARTAGDAALDFEMKMLLETKEAEASAARLEKSLTGVLNIFEGIGKAATRAVGMIAMAVKAPADLDNYLGSLNTKVTTMNGNLENYRKIMIEMETKQRKPGDLMFGFSPEDFQKVQMNFARGASEAEKYGKQAGSYQEQFGQGVGGLVKLVGMTTEAATQSITSFHRELGISYKEMGTFSKYLGALNKLSGMTAEQNKKLYRSVTSIGRAYGLTGENAKKFVLESVAVGSALSKIGLDAEEIVRKINSISSGSEKGLIQSLLLGFKPGDPIGQLQAFQDQAKMITQIASSAGEQFAPYLTRQLGDALGMGDFSVEEIQALAKGQSIEKEGKTELVDVVDVLKNIQKEMATSKATEDFYTTGAMAAQQKITEAIGSLQEAFWNAYLDLKKWITEIDVKAFFEKAKEWMKKFGDFIDKIDKFFGGDGTSALTKLGIGAGLVAIVSTVVPAVLKFLAGLGVKGLASIFTTSTAPTAATTLPSAGLLSKLPLGPIGIGISLGVAINRLIKTIADLKDEESLADNSIKRAEEHEAKLARHRLTKAKQGGDISEIVKAQQHLSEISGTRPPSKFLLNYSKWENPIKEASTPYNIDPKLIGAIVQQESRFNPNAVSKKGAIGLGQIMPDTAEWLKPGTSKKLTNYKTNLSLSSKYVDYLSKMFNGDTEKVIASYNAGQGRVKGLIKEHGSNWKDYLPDETKDYLSKVSENYATLQQVGGPRQDALQLAQGHTPESATEGSEVKDTTTHGLLSKVVSVLEQVQTTLTNNPTAPVQQTASLSNTIQGGTGYEWTQMSNAALVASPAR